jgi:hypothetical protein
MCCSRRCAASACATPSSPPPPAARFRLKLLKIGVQVRKSVRRIKVAMASACPYQTEYHLAYLYLRRAAF